MNTLGEFGEVITFYSYKGGTGRTMALANVACILAENKKNKNVLMIDWDLEAPGLHRFFYDKFKKQFKHNKMKDFDKYPGLIDLFLKLNEKINTFQNKKEIKNRIEKIYNEINIENFIIETDISNLYLMKAGSFDEFYSSKVNTFSWESVYSEAPFIFLSIIEKLSQKYRFILIDSRTGLNDISNICTMVMPEKLIVVFTPNAQSLTGVIDLIKTATEYRKQSNDLRPLIIFPLPSRIELSRPSLHEAWRFGDKKNNISGYQNQFEEILKEVYEIPECSLDEYFNEVQIQHVPEYAFGEEIAVIVERGESRLSLARSYENFAERLIKLPKPWWKPEKIIAKVYISYRKVEPDKSLANYLTEYLSEIGHKVFLDTQILVGIDWASEITKQILSADVFIVLLSNESVKSDMIRQEIRFAYENRIKKKQKLIILPIRVNYQNELPYDLGAYLDQIQYATWNNGDSYDSVSSQIASAISKVMQISSIESVNEYDTLLESTSLEEEKPSEKRQKVKNLQFALETGAVRIESPFYIQRKADIELRDVIKSRGGTILIEGLQGTGKTSLLIRAFKFAKNINQKVIFIDFQLIDKSDLASLDNLFRYLVTKICKDLEIPYDLKSEWDELIGPMHNFTNFIEENILFEANNQITFIFDGVERILIYPFGTEFFSLIRAWHNKRSVQKSWNFLNIIIAYHGVAQLLRKDVNESPFNIGYRIELEDFTINEISELNQRYGKPLEKKDLANLMDITGGIPYLTRLAFYTIIDKNWTFTHFIRSALSDNGPFSEHLNSLLFFIKDNKSLMVAIKQILFESKCDSYEHFINLKLKGLVKGTSEKNVRMRSKLYETFFKRHV